MKLATALFALILSGCASASGVQPTTSPGRSPSAAGSATSTPSDLDALYRARTDSALARFTEADVRFVTGMIGHHAQALVMAGLAPSHGASATLQTLAARIINAQKDEIALMERWLKDRGQPVPMIMIEGTELMVHGAEHAMEMPGMLTPEQMRQLDQARGPAFDRLFLTLMIQHHKGAVTMVEELFRTDGAAQGVALFRLASDVQVDQRTEIARMERMLVGGGR